MSGFWDARLGMIEEGFLLTPVRRTRCGPGQYARVMRWAVILAGLVVLVTGCGRGYEDSNREIVADLPNLDDVELRSEEHYESCSGDTCLFGNDHSGALLGYSVNVDQYTQSALVDAYRTALTDWNLVVDESCTSIDPTLCDETAHARFIRGDARIDIGFDNWSVGRYEIHVDAKGGK